MSSNEFVSKYESFFQNRLFSNLPKSSEWVIISNIDFVICNYQTKKFILVELKTKGNEMKNWQKGLYNMLHRRLMHTNDLDNRSFQGTYCIRFMGENFSDPVFIQGTNIKEKRVDEETLKNTLYYLIH